MKKIIVLLSVVVLAACGASKVVVSAPAQSDVDRGAKIFTGLTLNELNQGKTAYEANCGKCHGLKNPVKFTEAQWRKEVPPMAKKAKVDAKTEELILKYVVTMSGATQK
ncbi:MAG: hypothetical protein ACKOXB_08925 [Flavobacteriales bacterium]